MKASMTILSITTRARAKATICPLRAAASQPNKIWSYRKVTMNSSTVEASNLTLIRTVCLRMPSLLVINLPGRCQSLLRDPNPPNQKKNRTSATSSNRTTCIFNVK